MVNFISKLEEALDSSQEDINPDSIYSPGSITVLYALPHSGGGGPLITAPYPNYHAGMFNKRSVREAVLGRYASRIDWDDRAQGIRDQLTAYALLGRVGSSNGRPVVAFWNHIDDRDRESALADCLRGLLGRRQLSGVTRVVCPGIDVQTVDELLGNGPTKVSVVDWDPELLRIVHTLAPKFKKEILGLLGGGQSDWHRAWKLLYSSTGDSRFLYAPWRSTSEGKNV